MVKGGDDEEGGDAVVVVVLSQPWVSARTNPIT